jgi:hypothetical protein
MCILMTVKQHRGLSRAEEISEITKLESFTHHLNLLAKQLTHDLCRTIRKQCV